MTGDTQVNIPIQELTAHLCPECKKKIQHLLAEKIAERMI